jgi:hypothetical protein
MIVQQRYQVRFINQADREELLALYRLARVPLSGQRCGTYERMQWAAKEFSKKHPEISSTAAYKDLDGLLA